jgi:hypothetical protein
MKTSTFVLSLFVLFFHSEARKETRKLEVFSFPEEVTTQGQKLATLPTLGREFHASFEFQAERLDVFHSILEFRKNDTETILALRAAKDDLRDGMKFQLFAKFGNRSTTTTVSPVEDYGSIGFDDYCEKPFLLNPASTWIAVEVSTRRAKGYFNDVNQYAKNDEDYLLTVKIRKNYLLDSRSTGIESNIDFYYSKPKVLHNIEVYAGSVQKKGLGWNDTIPEYQFRKHQQWR